MALLGGHRFAVPMADLFPHGFYALGVEQAMDYDGKNGRQTPTKDKVTGELVWTVTGVDRDPEARKKEVKVKVTARVMPALPPEILPGSGLHAVEFTGLTVTPYVEDGRGPNPRARLALSYRATGVWEQGKVPADTATDAGRRSGQPAEHAQPGRSGGHAAPAGPGGSGGSGDGKAA